MVKSHPFSFFLTGPHIKPSNPPADILLGSFESIHSGFFVGEPWQIKSNGNEPCPLILVSDVRSSFFWGLFFWQCFLRLPESAARGHFPEILPTKIASTVTSMIHFPCVRKHWGKNRRRRSCLLCTAALRWMRRWDSPPAFPNCV